MPSKNHFSFAEHFVPKRDIHDTILIAREILSNFHQKRKKLGYTGIKTGYGKGV